MLVASPSNCNVFVGGLDHGVTSEILHSAFEAFSLTEGDKAVIKVVLSSKCCQVSPSWCEHVAQSVSSSLYQPPTNKIAMSILKISVEFKYNSYQTQAEFLNYSLLCFSLEEIWLSFHGENGIWVTGTGNHRQE